MTFIEVYAKPVAQENMEHFIPITLNINFIRCIAPYKNDTDRTVIKCEEKTAYIIDKPYDEIKKLIKNELIESNINNKYDTTDWGWI